VNQMTGLALAVLIGVIGVGIIRAHPTFTVGVSTALNGAWAVDLYFMTKAGAPSIRGTPRAIFQDVLRSGYRVSWQAQILLVAMIVLMIRMMAFQLRG
jgi:hypothetical protein